MSNTDVANQIILSMGRQIDLIFTLSVAICGGIIALVFQLVLHNSKTNGSFLKIEWGFLLWLSFLSEGVSVLFGYLSRGAITANIPSIYNIDFSQIETWGAASFSGFCTLKWVISLQFWTFLAGVFLLFLLVLKNLKVIVKE
ncbi:MAG: hypothetical protein ABIL06_00895 [Pseudomonadota bacterium]